jgi:hypothetical protein
MLRVETLTVIKVGANELQIQSIICDTGTCNRYTFGYIPRIQIQGIALFQDHCWRHNHDDGNNPSLVVSC